MNLQELQELAQKGNAEAQFQLGNMYYNCNDIETDYKEAQKWYKKAAEQGYAEAQCMLGEIYKRDAHNNYNFVHSKEWLKDKKTYVELIHWFKESIEQEYDNAKQMLNSINSAILTYDEIVDWWINASYKKAKYWLEKSAEQGNVKAFYELGLISCCSDEPTEEEYKTSIYWLEKAAEQDYPNAKYHLIMHCRRLAGLYGSSDWHDLSIYKNSIQWYEKAVEYGDSYSMCRLGKLYYYGFGTKIDRTLALKYLTMAAEQGDSGAQDLINLNKNIVYRNATKSKLVLASTDKLAKFINDCIDRIDDL